MDNRPPRERREASDKRENWFFSTIRYAGDLLLKPFQHEQLRARENANTLSRYERVYEAFGFAYLMDAERTLLQWALSRPNPFAKVPSPEVRASLAKKSLSVPDGTYAITTAASKTPDIGTYGMYPCVAIGATIRGSAAVAHFRTFDNPADLWSILGDLTDREPGTGRFRDVTVYADGAFSRDSVRLALGLLQVIHESGATLGGLEMFEQTPGVRGFSLNARSRQLTPGIVPEIELPDMLFVEDMPKVYDARLTSS